MATDMLYMLTFAVGILMFWVSGHVADVIPILPNETLDIIVSVGLTTLVFSLGIAIFSFFMQKRQFKLSAIAGLAALVLGIVADRVVVGLASGHISTQQDLTILTFVLYLVYGTIYVLALAIGRRFAKRRRAAPSFDAEHDPSHNE
jgi:MFS family permease